ncbi:MAG: ABC transporter permease subunit [Bacillota bacterium]|nr:ABC transporter permease subunit [Bacillota bacterium]
MAEIQQQLGTAMSPGGAAAIGPSPGRRSREPLNWKRIGKRIWRYKWIYVMMLPTLLVIFIFRYIPMYGLQLAFKNYKLAGIAASPWNDFAHFKRMLGYPGFMQALQNTLIISMMRIVIGFPFPIILALMINEVRLRRSKRVLQTIYTFPHFLSWVLLAGIMLNMFGQAGIVRKVIEAINPAWAADWNLLYDAGAYRWMVVFSDMWKEAGWGTIIYLAAIAGIDEALFEAAAIDGAGRGQRIRHILLPGIIGMIAIQFVLRIGSMMEGGFDQIFNTYNEPVYRTGDIIDTFVYRMTFQRGADMGFTTAVGLFKNVVNFALLLMANAITRALGQRTLW